MNFINYEIPQPNYLIPFRGKFLTLILKKYTSDEVDKFCNEEFININCSINVKKNQIVKE